ncbi:molybdopterin-guanine dinucleotide biosynthesis protein B [Chthonobacter albigriseus]|uniref:molybdopterin-guanine dinucleotide biosynthesis protein B n=1 Tax=Chthonobacter albigriseus TaxID=1683161 RepID=UPI0015EEB8D3
MLDAEARAPAPPSGPLVVGVAGWKKSGKTTLASRLVANFVARGLKVATVKHAHHSFEVDREGTDSWRHREAGASEVALVSAARVAIMSELARPEDEPPLAEILKRLQPADVVVVEGYKGEPIPKVEVRRLDAHRHDPLHPGDPTVVAIAADHPVEGAGVPVFPLDDVAGIADFLLQRRTR